MRDAGIILESCKICTDEYGVSEDLKKLGIDVKYMGVPFTDYLKKGYHVITF